MRFVCLVHIGGGVQARGKTQEDVKGMLDAGYYDMQQLLDGGWVTGVHTPLQS